MNRLELLRAEILQHFHNYEFEKSNEINDGICFVNSIKDILSKVPEDLRPIINNVEIKNNIINISFNQESVKVYEEHTRRKWNNITISKKDDRINMIF